MARQAVDYNRWLQAKERGGLVELPHVRIDSSTWRFIPFLFNPHEFSEDDTQNYSRETVPMFADQIVQYVGGGGANFKFDMILEQDRLFEFLNYKNINQLLDIDKQGSRQFFDNQTDEFKAKYIETNTVEKYIARIEELKSPKMGDAGDYFGSSPSRVMVVFGSFYRIGYITKTDIKITEFYSKGQIRSATVGVSMILPAGRMNYYRGVAKGNSPTI